MDLLLCVVIGYATGLILSSGVSTGIGPDAKLCQTQAARLFSLRLAAP
jgi:hypothetical protein